MAAGLPADAATHEHVVAIEAAGSALAGTLAGGQDADAWAEAELPLRGGLPGDGQGDGAHEVAGVNAAAGVVEDVGAGAVVAFAGEAVAAAAAHVPGLEGAGEAELPGLGVEQLPLQGGAVALPEVGRLAGPAGDRCVEGVVGVGVEAGELQLIGESSIKANGVVLVAGAAGGAAAEGREGVAADLPLLLRELVGGGNSGAETKQRGVVGCRRLEGVEQSFCFGGAAGGLGAAGRTGCRRGAFRGWWQQRLLGWSQGLPVQVAGSAGLPWAAGEWLPEHTRGGAAWIGRWQRQPAGCVARRGAGCAAGQRCPLGLVLGLGRAGQGQQRQQCQGSGEERAAPVSPHRWHPAAASR